MYVHVSRNTCTGPHAEGKSIKPREGELRKIEQNKKVQNSIYRVFGQMRIWTNIYFSEISVCAEIKYFIETENHRDSCAAEVASDQVARTHVGTRACGYTGTRLAEII